MPDSGWRIGLALTPTTSRPGWRVALEFVPGPWIEPSAVRPGGSLPAAAVPGFGGVLYAQATGTPGAALVPGGALPLAVPGFAGQLAAASQPPYFLQPGSSLPAAQLAAFGGQANGFYAERHSLAPAGSLPQVSLLVFAGHLAAPYDSRVQRPLARMARALRFEQAQHASAAVGSWFEDARAAASRVQSVVQQAQTLAMAVQGTAQQANNLHAQVRDTAQQARPLRQHSASGFEVARPLRHAVRDAAQQAQSLPVVTMVYAWQIANLRRGQHLERFEQAGIQRHMGLRVPPAYALGPGWRIALEFAPQFITPRTWAELQSRPLVSGAGLAQHLAKPTTGVRYQDTMRPGPATAKVPWPPEGGGTDPGDPGQPGQTIIITARRAYIMQNSITLTRLDTGAELQAHSFGMSLDYQSWTWSWQASLHHSAAAHLGRDAQGDPAELLATINGVPFRLRLERVARDRRHLPQERFSVSGKGRAAVLDAPWAPQMQFGNQAGDYTALQLALNVLTINGVPIDWGIDWRLDDWLVPQGAWAMQGSYIAAINDIAQAAGGYVQPHNTDAVLRILHKYPAAPWEWADLTPDFDIPAALAEVESTEYLDKPDYNRVYVGGMGQGVFGPLTRAGTAGHKTAPQVTHPLITAAAAWRQRGRAELSDTGRQERIRISLPVLPETGVIVPGQFVRYQGEQKTIGIVRGTSIDWQRPRLRQTLEIEAHEPV